jgi:uncharacterized protein (TIGR03546 family)
MLLPRFVSKWLAVLRGNVAPPLIFISAMLGIWVGLMPGWAGLHTVLTVIVLILNVHIGLFLLALGLGKAICLAAAPVLYYTGVWAHGHLGGLLAGLKSIPIVGITDFDRYAVAGGLVLGPIIGALCGLAVAFLVYSFRRTMLTINEKSEKFRLYYSKLWVRILDRILVGKRTKDVHAMFAKAKYIRKVGVALALLVVVGFLVAAHFLSDNVIKKYATDALTSVNKAEADIDNLGVSLLGANVAVSGLQLTDPKNPQQNQISIAKMATAASMYDLLLGKLVVNKVELSQVRFGDARKTPGTVLPQTAKEPQPFDPNRYKIDAGDVAALEKYVKDTKQLKEQLEKLRNWLPKGKSAGTDQGGTAADSSQSAAAQAPEEKPPQKFSEYLTARLPTAATPRLVAKQLLADKTLIPSKLFGNSRIDVNNISDAPQAAKLPISMQIKSYDTPALLKIMADYSKSSTPEISGSFEGFDLSKLESLSQDAGLAFQGGQASGTFTGTLTQEKIDLTINLNLKNLQAKGTGKGVLGLGAEQTSQVMQVLKELTTSIRVVGTVTKPQLVFDTKGLTKEFQQALVQAGKDRAIQEADKLLQKQLGDKLGDKLPAGVKDKLPDSLKDAIKQPSTKGLMDSVGGLLGGKKKQDQPDKK